MEFFIYFFFLANQYSIISNETLKLISTTLIAPYTRVSQYYIIIIIIFLPYIIRAH